MIKKRSAKALEYSYCFGCITVVSCRRVIYLLIINYRSLRLRKLDTGYRLTRLGLVHLRTGLLRILLRLRGRIPKAVGRFLLRIKSICGKPVVLGTLDNSATLFPFKRLPHVSSRFNRKSEHCGSLWIDRNTQGILTCNIQLKIIIIN